MPQPTRVRTFNIQDILTFKAVARSSGKKKTVRLVQQVYEDAMERAIKAVRIKATIQGRHGSVPISIGALEVEIAIRQELTDLAGGHVKTVGPIEKFHVEQLEDNHD